MLSNIILSKIKIVIKYFILYGIQKHDSATVQIKVGFREFMKMNLTGQSTTVLIYIVWGLSILQNILFYDYFNEIIILCFKTS